MKKLFSTLVIAGFVLPALAGEPSPLPQGFDYSLVTNHFTGCLNGQIDGMYNPTTYMSDYIVSHSDVSSVTTRIWEEWKKANTQFASQEESLTTLTYFPFFYPCPGNTYSYTIPQSLEPYINEPGEPDKYPGPNAQMQYYFGYKDRMEENMPLFIFMHGSGTVSEEIKGIKNAALLSDDGPSLYILPRIPNGWTTYYRWYHQSKQWVWEKIFRQAFLRSYIDSDRIYFMGISEGAYGSQRLASFYADYLGGVGPLAGGEPLTNAPAENLCNTYFNITTGQLDTAFGRAELTEYVGEWLDNLQAEYPGGYAHDVIIVPGADHGLYGGAYYKYTSPALLKHTRVTNPKHVRWENYAMDGRYRTGFYNLRVIERSELNPSNELERTYYEMDIDGNNIDMKVSVVNIGVDKWHNSYGASLPLKIHKNYTPATQGRFKIYLGDKLVDLSKEVVLTVNGRELYRGVLQPNLADMVNSCAEYYDPERVYPASIDVDLASMTGSALTSGIEDIIADFDPDAPVEYYTLQGIRLSTAPTTPGIYIARQGNATRKIYLR